MTDYMAKETHAKSSRQEREQTNRTIVYRRSRKKKEELKDERDYKFA